MACKVKPGDLLKSNKEFYAPTLFNDREGFRDFLYYDNEVVSDSLASLKPDECVMCLESVTWAVGPLKAIINNERETNSYDFYKVLYKNKVYFVLQNCVVPFTPSSTG